MHVYTHLYHVVEHACDRVGAIEHHLDELPVLILAFALARVRGRKMAQPEDDGIEGDWVQKK